MLFIEARKLAHEIVEAPRCGEQRAQGEIKQSSRRARPQHQREMRKIAALDEGADNPAFFSLARTKNFFLAAHVRSGPKADNASSVASLT